MVIISSSSSPSYVILVKRKEFELIEQFIRQRNPNPWFTRSLNSLSTKRSDCLELMRKQKVQLPGKNIVSVRYNIKIA